MTTYDPQFITFNGRVRTARYEVITQQVNLFNAASGNTLLLVPGSNPGDFSERTFLGFGSQELLRSRSPYSNDAIAMVTLGEASENTVKYGMGTKELDLSKAILRWKGMPLDMVADQLGRELGMRTMKWLLNAGIVSLSAAMEQIGANITNITAADPATTAGPNMNSRNLLKAMRPLGDQSSKIKAWVMHSHSWFDYVENVLKNQDGVVEIYNGGDSGLRVYTDILGNRFVVTDSPGLIDLTPNPDVYTLLGLAPGALVIEDNNDFRENYETKNGFENILDTYQAEWSHQIGLGGYGWDTANGGKAPTLSALGTGSNWDASFNDTKSAYGVKLKTI